jgi:hypothetical protein
MIGTTLGGYKFPDGTVQTTAGTTGLQQVFHDSTLTGNGTSASPLGIVFPLIVNAPVPTPDFIIKITNTATGGAISVLGGDNFGGGPGDLEMSNTTRSPSETAL